MRRVIEVDAKENARGAEYDVTALICALGECFDEGEAA